MARQGPRKFSRSSENRTALRHLRGYGRTSRRLGSLGKRQQCGWPTNGLSYVYLTQTIIGPIGRTSHERRTLFDRLVIFIYLSARLAIFFLPFGKVDAPIITKFAVFLREILPLANAQIIWYIVLSNGYGN
jgi:hypothetical protein